jgi:hypothetical protein
MGIEELIGFLLGVACGGLLRYLRGEESMQTGASEALSVRQPEPGEPSTYSAAEATGAPLAQQSELGEQTLTASVAADVGGSTQPTAAVGSLTVSPAVEEKRADLKTAILEILRSSGEGLTLSSIAEKLKRHFASIIGPVRLLIEEGLIEKQDKIYKIRGPA